MGGGVGDEEDGGGDSGGIATGTQKRGSKQGEALTSACFTLERREREVDRWKSRTNRKKGRRAHGTAKCEAPGHQAGAVPQRGQEAAAECKKSHSQSCGSRSDGRDATPPPSRSGCVRFASGSLRH